MFRIVLFVLLTLNLSFPAYAQYPQSNTQNQPGITSGPRKQLAVIVFAGLAGAILGLSTLSFYGRPQDHLSNIAVGFAVGIIVGTSYTTYKAATQPYEFYNSDYDPRIAPQPMFESTAGMSLLPGQKPVSFNYQFSF
ncbi:MAG: hypothetical protein HRT45_12150 [Bdellovibrionales bacterium]|nr:hypothetical protein [Bdellovibrionales bacterium]